MTRLGLIIPSSNTTMETEFCEMMPRGFSVHIARLRLVEVTLRQLALMEKNIEDAALKLADAQVNVIGYGCTSGSLFRGLGHDKSIEERIEQTTYIPAVATAGAVVAALRALSIRKVCVATPYTAEINDLEKKFLSSSGFQVVGLKGLGLKDNLKIGALMGEAACRLIMELDYHTADGIFLSCTNLATAGIVEKLEHMTEKSVVSSNTATMWAMLKKSDFSTEIKGFGRLLEST